MMRMRVSVTAAAAQWVQRSTSVKYFNNSLTLIVEPTINELAETRSSSPHNALHSPSNYRKRGSASYIVLEVLSVRERERERERERDTDRQRERERRK